VLISLGLERYRRSKVFSAVVVEGSDAAALRRGIGHIPGTTRGGEYHYRVVSTGVVSPREVSVLRSTGEEVLTLVTCYPFYFVGSAPNRFIVRAKMIPPSEHAQREEPTKPWTNAAISSAAVSNAK
jgi:sortase (surface protein transpeptidase)